MKKFKLLTFILFFVLTIGSMTSCDKNDEPSGNELYGKWNLVRCDGENFTGKGKYVVFNSDGTGVWESDPDDYWGGGLFFTYKKSGNYISMTIMLYDSEEGYIEDTIYARIESLSKNYLILSLDGEIFEYSK